jgi:hypothetical protein
MEKETQKEIEVEVTQLTIDSIRLKFHNLPNDSGPDLIIDPTMARTIIYRLQSALPEYVAELGLAERAVELLRGTTLTRAEGNYIIDIIDKCIVPDPIPEGSAEMIQDTSGQPIMKCTKCERLGHTADKCPGLEG